MIPDQVGVSRHVLITGASSGIGAELARYFASPQTTLSLFGRNQKRLNDVSDLCRAKGSRTYCHCVDLQDIDAVVEILTQIDKENPVDVLIANAGMGGQDAVAGLNGEHPAIACKISEVNFTGVIATVTALVPAMSRRRSGRIAIISSMAAMAPMPFSPTYSATKAGISNFAYNLRIFLQPHGVSVTLVSPGFVLTPMSKSLRGPRPLAVTAEEAAARIGAAINRRKSHLIFPRALWMASLLSRVLPASLVMRFQKSWQ